jgi:hypothetical protein
MFENKGLRRIFRLKREDITGKERKLHYEELYTIFFSSQDIISVNERRRNRWTE